MRIRILLVAALLAGLAAIAAIAGCDSSTYLGRWFLWRESDVDDHRRFPFRKIDAGEPGFRFLHRSTPFDPTFEVRLGGKSRPTSLTELARATSTTALLVVRRDTILYEGYFHGSARESIQTSFSVAKSITSLLVGIALDEGAIGDLDDPVTRYVPELRSRDSRFERITLRHLLDMRSGIAFADHDLPWGDKPKAYYDPHLRERLRTKLTIAEPPGRRWVYNSYNPILLGLVLERATGMNVARYMQDRLWKRIDAEFDASWSLDGTSGPIEKMESGINARAVDFARMGRLVLRRGQWDHGQVVSPQWIDSSTTAEPGCELDEFRPRRICYRHAWWLHPGDGRERRAIGAWGHLGQFLYVFPAEEVVIVRFGKEAGEVPWSSVFQSLVAAIEGAPR